MFVCAGFSALSVFVASKDRVHSAQHPQQVSIQLVKKSVFVSVLVHYFPSITGDASLRIAYLWLLALEKYPGICKCLKTYCYLIGGKRLKWKVVWLRSGYCYC